MLKHRREIENSRCLNCTKCRNEKAPHVLKCKNEKAKKNHVTKIRVDLRKEMEDKKTSPTLAAIIENLMLKWKEGTSINPNDYTTDFNIRDAIKDQQKIGWTNWVIGRWSPKWQRVQKLYYKSIRSRRSSLRWTIAIIKKFILICWDVWDFRNTLIHGKGGVVDRATNKELNFQIRQEFIRGRRNLLKVDKWLFKKYDRKTLYNMPIDDKKSWLRNISKARKAFERTYEPTTLFAQQTIDQFTNQNVDNLD